VDTVCIDIDIIFCYLQITPTIIHVTTNGGSNGKIILNVQYGVPPYHFIWSNGDSTQTISNLTAGTYSVTVCDGLMCCDSAFITVIEPIDSSDYEVQGMVYAGANPLPLGVVIAYKMEPDSSCTALKLNYINDGFFSIYPNVDGNFLLYAIPYLDIEYPFTPVYFPTYFGNSLHWNQANDFHLESKFFNADINLVSNNTMIWGEGSISGKILYSFSGSYENSIYNFDWFGSSSGNKLNSARNIPVILFNENHIPLLFELSDENGNYSFNNLEYGTYHVYAEKAGLLTEYAIITINDTDLVFTNLDIVIGVNKIILDSETADISDNYGINIFPNPASEKLYIKNEMNSDENCTLRLIKSDGGIVLNELINFDNFHVINIHDFPPGIYTLEIIGDSVFKTKKIIIF
jgi:hypothetical protein